MKIEDIHEIIKTTTLRGKLININTSCFTKTLQNYEWLKILISV